MDILYLLYKLYYKGYCNCDIVVVCDLTDVNLCILFFRAFYMTIKYSTPRRCMCVISRHIEPATMAPNEIRGLVMVPCQRQVISRPPADQRREAVVHVGASRLC